MEKVYLDAKDVSQIMGISVSTAYKVIRSLNDELSKNGYLVIAGKVSRRFFNEKCYGYEMLNG